MDDRRFDAWTKAIAAGAASRRMVARGLVSTTLGALALHFVDSTSAKKRKKKRKKRKKKLQRNEFGCVEVGGKCLGSDANCCSGVCQGKKPKKGKKDKSVCGDHNVGDCTPERDICITGDAEESACGANAVCTLTTGGAAFCGNQNLVDCRICSTDADCEGGFGIGAACILLDDRGVCTGENSCVGVNGSNGTACVGPGA